MAGQLVHFEIQAQDIERAAGFYRNALGIDFQASGMPGMDYRVARTGENQGGGLYESDNPGGNLIVYFDTDDIEASLAKVRENGGSGDDKQPIPGVGWFAPCKDSEGNAFSLFQSDESVAPPGQ